MKSYKTLLIIILIISCKSNNDSLGNETKIEKIINEDLSSYISDLPIGKKELLENDLDLKKMESIGLFKYYDTINGKPSSNFKPIKNSRFESFYKPSKADSINEDDSFFLSTNDKYCFFKLTKILPNENDNTILIFDGLSTTVDYDGNPINISRKDIVIVDGNSNIIEEMNIYFNYTDGIVVRVKLFFIDENYNIFLRYYNEGEEGEINFTENNKYSITSKGKIIKL